jgi:hypothetical protein
MAFAPLEIRCRPIDESDLPALAELLVRGFPNRGRPFWNRALARLSHRDPPPNLPKYGYLLETDGTLVGAILLICAAVPTGGAIAPRCNLSSWYVEPAFRSYAPLLISQALQHKEVTYLNISAAPHTWPIIEAQGFLRYCNGSFICLPALSRTPDTTVGILEVSQPPRRTVDPVEQDLLLQHAQHGCISLWCVTQTGAHPFIFWPDWIKGFIPCAQLIYCRNVADLVCLAAPIGRYLVRCGRPILLVDANAPIPGLVGLFRQGREPKYFKGPQRPRLGDLAYTECAILGM